MNDLTIAFFSFEGHRDLLINNLESIYRHAPPHKEIILVWDDFVRERPIDFNAIRQTIGENFRVVLHSDIYTWSEPIGRWGWIKQQLAKMCCYRYTTTKYTWIVDGDVFIKGDPQLFHQDGRPYLRFHSRPTHTAYTDFIGKYLHLYEIFPHDFVGSTCLFENIQCEKIDAHARLVSDMSLIDCVNDCITSSTHDPLPFSEFETYGTWIYNTCPDSHKIDHRNWNYAREPYVNQPIQIGFKQRC